MFIQGNRIIKKGTLDGRLIEKACIGDNDLFPDSWLSPIAETEILTKFGQADGSKIVSATEDYLNNLQSTNNDKAQMIARLINEDPMFVCSIEIQPNLTTLSKMPVRLLRSDGTAWVETNCTIETGDYCKIQVVQPSSANYWSFFGQGSGYNKTNAFIYAMRYTHANCYIGGRVDFGTSINTYINIPMIFEGDHTIVKVTILSNGVQSSAYSNASSIASTTETAKLFRGAGSASNLNVVRNWEIGYAQIGSKRDMKPFIRNGVNGMIDLVTETFYPNNASSGSFSIVYRFPSGTQWTPGQ